MVSPEIQGNVIFEMRGWMLDAGYWILDAPYGEFPQAIITDRKP